MSASSSSAAAPSRASCPACKAVFRGDFRRCPNDGGLLVESDTDPLVGTVLAERYQIEAVLGDGGLGRVYRARHVRMSRRFAIKVPFGEVGYDRKSRARLANEAEAASRLDHPNVIGVIDVGETPAGLFYLAMDLADGPSLAELVADDQIAPDQILTLLVQLADGLTHAHERGLVHRDLKPENVVVTTAADGTMLPRVIDFGLALVDDGEPSTRLTTEGLVVGTPYYMAPEQATGEDLDHRADLFALGIILFELLAGCLPFDGAPAEVARQNVTARLPTVLARSGRVVDPLLEALVTWLTRKRRAERPLATRDVLAFARRLSAGDRAGARELISPPFRPPADATLAIEPAPAPPRPGLVAEPAAEPRAGLVAEPTAEPAPGAELEPALDLPPRRRRWPLAALALIAVIAAIALVAWPRSSPTTAPAAIAVVDAGVPVDAADIVALAPVVDAAPAVAPPAIPLDAAPAPSVRARPPIDAAVSSRPRAPVDAAPAAPPPSPAISLDGLSLKAQYKRIATELDAAMSRLGTDRTAALRRRFDAVPPYLDAVRKPTLRIEAEAELRALARDLNKLPR
ncbi:MAG: protein kinase [Myxococcales bacterium]|nr:protein kinase [Myxococcales bacterium]